MICPKQIRLPKADTPRCWGYSRVDQSSVNPLRFLAILPLMALSAAADHWAFEKVKRPSSPATIPSLSRSLADAHHQTVLGAHGMEANESATRQVLARRLAFHLRGLPAAFDEVAAFEADDRLNAYERHVDRLLASSAYGERQARKWLDVARYADNKGYVFQEERRYPYAYTFRDWVVRAFNEDLPYDQFLMQQLAGDHVAKETGDSRAYAAMGFLTLGRRFLNRTPDIIDDRIDVVTRGMLGLTVSCARCHDHKFDPIPIEDYYSLYGVFNSSEEPSEKPLLGPPDESSPDYQAFLKGVEERQHKIDHFFAERHAKLREAPLLKQYFALTNEGWDWDDTKLSSRAQKEKLYQKIALQWRARLQKLVEEGHPVFLPWKTFRQVAFENVSVTLDELREHSHPLIWQALSQAAPQSMDDVLEIYAEVIASSNQLEPHQDPDKETLRQLLVAKDSPTGLEPEQLYRIFNTPDQEHVRRLRRELKKFQAVSPGAPPRGMAMVDKAKPVEPHVFLRGSASRRGKRVPRQFLVALAGDEREPFQQGSGRYELAKAIASPDNPLTARVFVNRAWQHFFGKPLVESPSDFGIRTERPALGDVLDLLAADFVENGWSIKRLHRQIVTSQIYRQSNSAPVASATKDPENVLVTYMNRQRLDFESMRDAILSSAGDLECQMGGQPVDLFAKPFAQRRALYGFIDRQNLPSEFRTFDMASPDAHSPQRLETTVPQQALYMMNGPLLEQQAQRLGAQAQTSEDGIGFLYRRLFARLPSARERELGERFLQDWQDGEAWTAYAQALLCSNEFMFID